MRIQKKMNHLYYALGLMALAAGTIQAQVPPDIEAGLKKIGQIVDPPCTAKLYRPLMPVNDVNSAGTPLYPTRSTRRWRAFSRLPAPLAQPS
jgi:hypothetical protein